MSLSVRTPESETRNSRPRMASRFIGFDLYVASLTLGMRGGPQALIQTPAGPPNPRLNIGPSSVVSMQESPATPFSSQRRLTRVQPANGGRAMHRTSKLSLATALSSFLILAGSHPSAFGASSKRQVSTLAMAARSAGSSAPAQEYSLQRKFPCKSSDVARSLFGRRSWAPHAQTARPEIDCWRCTFDIRPGPRPE